LVAIEEEADFGLGTLEGEAEAAPLEATEFVAVAALVELDAGVAIVEVVEEDPVAGDAATGEAAVWFWARRGIGSGLAPAETAAASAIAAALKPAEGWATCDGSGAKSESAARAEFVIRHTVSRVRKAAIAGGLVAGE